MARKTISWKTKGMNRDFSVSAFNAEFAFENRNLRLSSNEGNTMMSWVNERGTKKLKLKIDLRPWESTETEDRYAESIEGIPIGTAVLNHKLTVFTTTGIDGKDCIYVFQTEVENNETYLKGKVMYKGNLNFDTEHPLETLVSYESETVQKIYWTDGINQPRVINIAASADTKTKSYMDSSFDFIPELALEEDVHITKIYGEGEFPAGVIQYAFTYYNKYGQESNIFHTTPLQYITYTDRGGSADSKIANSFKIDITGVDTNFDYLRIYSILRMTKDGTPFVKRVQDIEIPTPEGDENIEITYIDNGLQGESIDPTELLYKGGEQIVAGTMEQKDGTLFFGNIKMERTPLIDIKKDILADTEATKEEPLVSDSSDKIVSITDTRRYAIVSKPPLTYINTLSPSDGSNYRGAAYFKSREYYRLGLQFQYKTGKWSEPCWIGDKKQTQTPMLKEEEGIIAVPIFRYNLENKEILQKLSKAGYKKVRPVFAVPNQSDRTVLCQGVGCPTVYRPTDKDGEKYRVQSSWLFRTPSLFSYRKDDGTQSNPSGDASGGAGKISYVGKLKSQYDLPIYPYSPVSEDKDITVSPYLRSTEIMGKYDEEHSFRVNELLATIHSPELQFDDSFSNMDYNGCKMQMVGKVILDRTYGDIDIQTSTPAIGSDSAGFVHRSIVTEGYAALMAAPFYNDYLVNDQDTDKYEAYHTDSNPIYYPVYMWHKNGSLNNDVNRSNRSAQLLKKKISNYRFGKDTVYYNQQKVSNYQSEDMQLFDSDELSIVKIGDSIYMGNINTMLTPSEPSPFYLIGNPEGESTDPEPSFDADSYYQLKLKDPNDTSSKNGIWEWRNDSGTWDWKSKGTQVGNKAKGLCQWREPVSMKYKSTAHLVVKLKSTEITTAGQLNKEGIYKPEADTENPYSYLPLVEITKEYDKDTLYGGTSDDAMKALTWIPCGDAVYFNENTEEVYIYFMWGDTYLQRFECLKTYPYTQEDKNQVVEIASFMCETRVNMDGRYDRNRGQVNNLNMTPQNFNLLNPVYSQMNNFFSYKIMDDEDYENASYPNNITWTKTKQNGADIDLWTNLTIANTMELDGDKGKVTKIARLNNQLLAFQDSGISQILYNENTQISTTEGVPIEIANSQKVQGKRYYSDTVGCSNKWTIVQTPLGIYFMDSNEKSIYLFNGQLSNLSTSGGLNAWAKQNIPSAEETWNPETFNAFVGYYDKQNQDVLYINNNTALAYSEKFGCFTSFYDYGKKPYLNNMDDMGIWVTREGLWQHQAGEYCNFFGESKPFSMTLIANQEPQTDKIFTNIEFRACVSGDGEYDKETDKFTPTLPFDKVETWDEYQHGILSLTHKNGKTVHGTTEGELNRKFRIWRCDVPRDNAKVNPLTEVPRGIRRFKERPLDRMRNTWIYLKLKKEAASEGNLSKTEIHDIMVSYFN